MLFLLFLFIKMWNRLFNQFLKCNLCYLAKQTSSLLPCGTCGQQIRTTYILKRTWQPNLHKKDQKPKTLRARHYIYELVEDTSVRKHEKVEVILAKYVEGLGNQGDVVSVKPNFAYNNLLLPGLAVYASPENLRKYSSEAQISDDEEKHSSPYAQKTASFLSRLVLAVCMNKEMPWTLEPWHIRMSFRKAGIHVPEKAITMPRHPIKGPDLSIESKEFVIKVTINGMETALVRCRIHHWSTAPADRLSHVPNYWCLPAEPLFPEEAELLKSLPPPASPKDAM